MAVQRSMAFLTKCTLRPKPESAGEMIIFMFTANREAENTKPKPLSEISPM